MDEVSAERRELILRCVYALMAAGIPASTAALVVRGADRGLPGPLNMELPRALDILATAAAEEYRMLDGAARFLRSTGGVDWNGATA